MTVKVTCFWCLQGGQSPGGGRGQPNSRVCRACNSPIFACCNSDMLCNDPQIETLLQQGVSLQGAGPLGQRTRFVPLPQSAISSNHNQRGQAKAPTLVPLPSPSSAARARSQPQLATQPPKPSSVLPNGAPTPSNVRPLQPRRTYAVATRNSLWQQLYCTQVCHLYALTNHSRHSQSFRRDLQC